MSRLCTYGVERPFVDTVIVPTTWFETGVGIHGEVGRGWRYRAFVTAPLNAAEFSADEGIREGKQKGSQANAGRVGTSGRLEYVGLRGLTAGASWWAGRSGFEFRPRFDVPVTLAEADARYSRNRFEGRLQFAQVWIDNADLLNDALTRRVGVDPNIARVLRGYAEGGYRLIEAARLGDVGAFVRYENFDATAWPVAASRCRSSIATRGCSALPTGPTPTSQSRPTTQSCATGARSSRCPTRSTSASAGGSDA
jgi:hypothetical protein